jgi:phage N-6-adenine-methyltransferase
VFELIEKALYSSDKNDWETPIDIFKLASDLWGPFDTDLAANRKNSLCKYFYSEKQNSLLGLWQGSCWLNPPYGRGIGQWVKKAYESVLVDETANKIVMLLPARTDTKYFHDYLWNEAKMSTKEGVTIRFIKGRLHFSQSKNAAPFPSMLVRFER